MSPMVLHRYFQSLAEQRLRDVPRCEKYNQLTGSFAPAAAAYAWLGQNPQLTPMPIANGVSHIRHTHKW